MTGLKKNLITLFHPLSSFPSELIFVVLNKRSLGSAISAALPRLAAFLGLSKVEGFPQLFAELVVHRPQYRLCTGALMIRPKECQQAFTWDRAFFGG